MQTSTIHYLIPVLINYLIVQQLSAISQAHQWKQLKCRKHVTSILAILIMFVLSHFILHTSGKTTEPFIN